MTQGSAHLMAHEGCKQTVYRWRCNGDGPRGYRVGKHLRYDLADVEQWLNEQRAL